MGDRPLETRIGPPCDDALRLELFNQHRQQRNLASSTDAYSFEDFHGFLVESCCESDQLSFWSGDSLVACSIIDSGQQSVSAVYTDSDPRYARLSPGTYSILKQMEWAAGQGKRYLYLGMFVADNQHLRYKARLYRRNDLSMEIGSPLISRSTIGLQHWIKPIHRTITSREG